MGPGEALIAFFGPYAILLVVAYVMYCIAVWINKHTRGY